MNAVWRRWLAVGLGLGLLAVLASCATGVYEGDVGVGYGVDYYEPYGYDYGHWHRDYHVAPPRGHEARPAHVETHASKPSYRSAPPSRPVPSIPSNHRSH